MKRIVSLALAILALLSSAAKCAESAPSGAEATAGIPANAKRTVAFDASWAGHGWRDVYVIIGTGGKADAKGPFEKREGFHITYEIEIGKPVQLLVHRHPDQRDNQSKVDCWISVAGAEIARNETKRIAGECEVSATVPAPDTHA